MTAKTETLKEETKEEAVQTPSEVQPKSQIEDATFVEPNLHDTHDPKATEIEETKENKAILKEDKDMKKKVASGDVSIAASAADLSLLQRAMVPHPLSGKPVYATADQSMLAESLKGNL